MKSTFHWADDFDAWSKLIMPALQRFINLNCIAADYTDKINIGDEAIHRISGFNQLNREMYPLYIIWKCQDGYVRIECLETKLLLLCNCSLGDLERAIFTIDKNVKTKS